MDSKKSSSQQPQTQAKIFVVGVGGGGNNSLESMIKARIDVQFIAVNTYADALASSQADRKI